MTLNFATNTTELIKDYRVFLFHSVLKKQNIVLLTVFIMSIILQIFSYKNTIIEGVSIFLLFGSLGVLTFELFMLVKNLYNVSIFAKTTINEKGTVTFSKNKIEFLKNKHTFVVFNSSIKTIHQYRDTIFIISDKSKFLPFRINKTELGESGYNLAIEQLKKIKHLSNTIYNK